MKGWAYGGRSSRSSACQNCSTCALTRLSAAIRSLDYDKWFADRGFYLMVGQAVAAEWLSSFKEFPPRQKPASFNLDEVIEQLTPKN